MSVFTSAGAAAKNTVGLLAWAITKGDQAANYGNVPVGNRAPTRLIVLEQSLRSGPLEARRTASSVALVISGECAAKFSSPELQPLGTRGMSAVCGTASKAMPR